MDLKHENKTEANNVSQGTLRAPAAGRWQALKMMRPEARVACLLATLLSGCMIPVPIPGRIETSPEVHGRVIDRRSRQPVAGARVSFRDGHGTERSRVVTGTNGMFVIGPERHTYLMQIRTPCPVYYLPRPEPYAWQLEIDKKGYVTREINLRDMYDQLTNNTFRLGDVEFGPIFWLTNTNTANQASQATAPSVADPGR